MRYMKSKTLSSEAEQLVNEVGSISDSACEKILQEEPQLKEIVIALLDRGEGVPCQLVRLMVLLVITICPHCHTANRDCQCWNDE